MIDPENGPTHGTVVSVLGRAVLILGPSGAGKSALALDMLSRGARLVADDRVELRQTHGGIWAKPAEAIQGLIEARFIGLLQVPFEPEAEIVLVVDLNQSETERLPEPQSILIGDVAIDLIKGKTTPNLGASLMVYLAGFRSA